jgi:AbrB family looped-hinge helix DNA binding protein
MAGVAPAHSKLTAQGQISVPARIRRKLGIGPGSVLEWDDDGEKVVVRRLGRYTSEDVHRFLFPTPPRPRTLADMTEGVRRYIKRRRARH